MSAPDPTDHALAAELATTAGRLLMELRERAFDDEVGNQGDALSNRFLLDELRRRRPADAILSEEAVDDPVRLRSARVWIVDPLDGTREFGEAGRTDWAVHVALWQQGDLVAGAVALPAIGETLSTAPGGWPPRRGPVRKIVVSRTRPPESAAFVAQALGAELVGMGSAGAKVAAVIRGEADAYVHAGGLWEWDAAAPVAVAVAAGLHATHVDGSPLVFNQARPWTGDLLVCRRDVADASLAALRP